MSQNKSTSFMGKLMRLFSIALLALLPIMLIGCSHGASSHHSEEHETSASTQISSIAIQENGHYTSKDEVAAYIHEYGHLPSNFISKTKARDAGWDAQDGNLQDVCPGKSIGGSRFHNDDGLLPDKDGRIWTECDIDCHGGHRGAKRIVFSNDGLIYYTQDHYCTFERLY